MIVLTFSDFPFLDRVVNYQKPSLEGLKVERPLSRKSNLEAKPVISDGHLKFGTTTHNLWMATVKQRSYQQLS